MYQDFEIESHLFLDQQGRVSYDIGNHKEYVLAKTAKNLDLNNPTSLVGIVLVAVVLLAVAFASGVAYQKEVFAAKNKPLVAPKSTTKTPAIDFAKASTLAQSKQYDQAIALLTPQVQDAENDKSQRIQGMNLIAQYYQAKTDPESAVKWYVAANTLAGSPRLDSTLGAASASAQLYALKSTGPNGPKGAKAFKDQAINYYTQAQSLATDPTLKSQIDMQLKALAKAE